MNGPKDEPAPSWPPVTITSDKLCNGDWNRRLKVEIFDYNDRYVQSGPSSVSYRDLLVAVLLYVDPLVALQEDKRVTQEDLRKMLQVDLNTNMTHLMVQTVCTFSLCITKRFQRSSLHIMAI